MRYFLQGPELNDLTQNYSMNFAATPLGWYDVSTPGQPTEVFQSDVRIAPVQITGEDGNLITTTDVQVVLDRTLKILNSRKDRRESRLGPLKTLERQLERKLISQTEYEERRSELQKTIIPTRSVNMVDQVNLWSNAGVKLIFWHSGPTDVAAFFKEQFMFETRVPKDFQVGRTILQKPTPTYALLKKGNSILFLSPVMWQTPAARYINVWQTKQKFAAKGSEQPRFAQTPALRVIVVKNHQEMPVDEFISAYKANPVTHTRLAILQPRPIIPRPVVDVGTGALITKKGIPIIDREFGEEEKPGSTCLRSATPHYKVKAEKMQERLLN